MNGLTPAANNLQILTEQLDSEMVDEFETNAIEEWEHALYESIGYSDGIAGLDPQISTEHTFFDAYMGGFYNATHRTQ